LEVTFISNFDLSKENGYSAWLAKDRFRETFVLLMADHLFDQGILRDLMAERLSPGEIILAVDFRLRGNRLVRLDDVTKVAVKNGRIIAIGKTIASYNGFDTGIFLCTPALFEALEDSQRTGDTSLSGGIRVLAGRGQARAMDIGARDWIDIDDEEDMRQAQFLFRQKS
jgi:choline kinase